MKKILYVFFLFMVGCTNNPTNKVVDKKKTKINEIRVESTNSINSESLEDANNYYYRSNIPTKDFAELVLCDSIMVNDYKGIHDCLDSLSSKNKTTRDYYFVVFKYVLDHLEVVLQESMGTHLVKNINEFKGEFLNRISDMNEMQIKFYAQGVECYLSEQKDKGKKCIMNIKLLKNTAKPQQISKLNLFLKEIELAKNDTME